MSVRIGIDVGGTFTDVMGFDGDKQEIVLTRKYTSNPADPPAMMNEILGDLERDFGGDEIALILHGSTAALNTLLEDKGVRVGLITTRGFRDVYEIGRQWRGDDVFNLFAPAPKMLLERDRIHEARGRLDYTGAVVTPLDRGDVERAARALVDQKVEAIAVCFLFSYANPAHEREAADIIRAVAPDIYISLSSDVNPEWREYERTASTVANAYIGPPVSRYLKRLEDMSLARFRNCRTLMMKSDGGAASAAMLAPAPIQTVMSGPVAGVIGARYLGDLKGIDYLITFDTGGTSSDMAVIPGRVLTKSEVSLGRHPLRTQTVDIDTIGAGGGSIASVQLGGVLKVGPQSAGARPGPACYDRGGTDATLTDALVALGHINPSGLLEGAMALRGDKAIDAVKRHVAEPLGMSVTDAAWGVLTVLIANCVAAMRTITVERGYDPREFTLVPFGGMGPTIAGRIAVEIGIRRMLVPVDPGTFSAWGMLVTDVHQERTVTRVTLLDRTEPAAIEATFAEIERQALAELVREKFDRDTLSTYRTAGMRYSGQSYEVDVPCPPIGGAADIATLIDAFHASHERRYGHKATNEAIEIVTFKVVAVGAIEKPKIKTAPSTGRAAAPVIRRQAYFGGAESVPTPVYRRRDLAPGVSLVGPAIIEEKTSTIVLYPGDTARVDDYLNIEIVIDDTATA
jgi:N-methylhydantoinase A